jgi:hypothetical protein
VGLNAVTVALFIPVDDEQILAKLTSEESIENIDVTVIPIAWE